MKQEQAVDFKLAIYKQGNFIYFVELLTLIDMHTFNIDFKMKIQDGYICLN